MNRLEISTTILTMSLLLAACSGGSPTVLAPAIRSEVSPRPTNAPSPTNLGDLRETERLFRNDPTDVTLVDVALVFAYFQNPGATPEQIVELVNNLTNENLTLVDFDSPFPTVADAGVFANPPDVVTLEDVAAIFAVFQGATELEAIAAIIANLVPGFDPADLNVVPGSLIPSPSPNPSPSQTDTPITSPPGTAAILTTTPNSGSMIALGTTPIGVATDSQTITIGNTGTAALEVEAASLTGDHPGDFTISPETAFIVKTSASSQGIDITCTPSELDVRTATLTFATNDPKAATLSYDLTCEGTLSERVNTLVDENDTNPNKCSLREAIIANNTNTDFGGCVNPNGTINFDPSLGSPLLLSEAPEPITRTVTISGPSADTLSVSGQNSHRIFEIAAAGNPAVTIENLTLIDGRATDSNGGAIFSASTEPLTIDSVTISDSNATGASPNGRGGGIYASNSNVYVTSSTLSGNGASKYGGGIYAPSGTVTVTNNSNLNGNNAGFEGGGISAFTVNVTNGSELSGNSVSAEFGVGGAIEATEVTVDNSTLSGNSASGINANGGAIRADTVTVTNASLLNGNFAGNNGGGIRAINVTVNQSSTLSVNTTDDNGGAIYALDTADVTSSTLSGNIAGEYGGGIYAPNSASVTVDQTSTLSSNNAANGGGIWAGTVNVNNSTLSDNIADGDFASGGGIRGTQVFVTNGSIISGNSAVGLYDGNAYGQGGGILAGGSATISDSTISNNSVGLDGGGIWAQNATVTENSIISGNTADNNGGGIRVGFSATVSDSSFSGNNAGENGGGIWLSDLSSGGDASISYSNLSGNTAGTSGGAIRNENGTLFLDSNNFGMAVMGGGDNFAPSGSNLDNLGGDVTGTSNDPSDCDGSGLSSC